MKNSDLSFLKECVGVVAVKETASLSALVADSFVEYATKPLGKIKIAALKREDYADQPEILAKYFEHNGVKLDRFHIPEVSPSVYENLVGDPKKLKNPANAKLKTATKYYVDKIKLMAVAKDLKCNAKQLDLTDYIWDERYYVRYDLIDNMRVVDDWFRYQPKESMYDGDAYTAYITNDPRTATMDMQLYDELYEFCITAIRQRKCMLLGKVDKCLSVLRNIAEYTNGFAENPTQQMIASMKGYKAYFEALFSDKDTAEWLKKNDDIKVFGRDELTRSDYIETYRTIIRSLVSGSDEDIRDLSDLLTETKDPYLRKICELKPTVSFHTWQLDN